MASLSVGEALAALAILLLLPSLLSPLVRFRLSVSRFREAYIHFVPLAAFILVVISYVIPETIIFSGNVDLNETLRIVSSVGFAAPIFVIGYAYYGVPKFSKKNHQIYLDGVTSLVSTPGNIPPEFAKDLETNLGRVITVADSINWPKVNGNAFYAFANRRDVEFARSASWIAELCKDKRVMDFLVTSVPASALRIVEQLRKCPHREKQFSQNKFFIKKITSEFLSNTHSPLNNEVGYDGLARIRLATRTLFSSGKQIERDRQLNESNFLVLEGNAEINTQRLLFACDIIVDKLIEDKILWSLSYFDLLNVYKSVFNLARFCKKDNKVHLWSISHNILEQIAKIEKIYSSLPLSEKREFFLKEGDAFYAQNSNLIKFGADLAYEFHMAFSNKLEDRPSDEKGAASFDILHAVFPSISENRTGISALQQQLMLKMLKKVDDNLRGYYPAFIRPLLTFFGPYRSVHKYKAGTAYDVFYDSFFFKMRKFPDLAYTKPKRSKDQLTSHYYFDKKTYEFVNVRNYDRGVDKFQVSQFPTSSADLFDPMNHR